MLLKYEIIYLNLELFITECYFLNIRLVIKKKKKLIPKNLPFKNRNKIKLHLNCNIYHLSKKYKEERKSEKTFVRFTSKIFTIYVKKKVLLLPTIS